MPETIDPSIPSAEDWAEVQFLIAEVQQAERETARYAACIVVGKVAAPNKSPDMGNSSPAPRAYIYIYKLLLLYNMVKISN